MSDHRNDLLLFFERPIEPCFLQKGDNKTSFQIPDNYYTDKYKQAKKSLLSYVEQHHDGRTISVRNIALPNLQLPMELPYNDEFSLFIPKHRDMAGKLIETLMSMRDVDDLISLCAYCQLRINPYMFNYCLSVALLHRPDTKGMSLPTIVESFPDKFMDPKAFRKAREVSTTVIYGNRMPIPIPQNYTASDAEPEQRVAYFREDIGVNLHHWHWHLVYPFDAAGLSGVIVNKDRRGELFYYMHQQLIARFQTERFCNNLGRIKRLNDFHAPIPEGYFPKLDSQVASRSWPPRFAGTTLKDIDRPADLIKIDISQLEIWRERFIEAIENGAIVLKNNRVMPLDESNGIDILGDLMEASALSRHKEYYGDFHNMGHVFVAYAHDPDHRHLESFGVMGDLATAMRDPLFYRWHSYIDDMFAKYKMTLTPYTVEQLDFPGIRVTSVGVEGPAGANQFATQWEQSFINLGSGLDLSTEGAVYGRFTHLQHDDFSYVIEVSNNKGRSVTGMFRVFMAPAADDNGPLLFKDQRRLMIELDKFQRGLKPGNNTIRRRSVDSSVTIPHERVFRSQAGRQGKPGTGDTAEFDFCGCGWPHHMLIPKGTPEGYPVVLLCMVTNYDEDKVEQDLVGACNDASSYCGLRDRKYPDKRPMGYPFDRSGRRGVEKLSDFLTGNMATRQCSIRFTDTIRVREHPKA